MQINSTLFDRLHVRFLTTHAHFFYNLQLQRVLISEAGRCYPRKRFSQYCVNSCWSPNIRPDSQAGFVLGSPPCFPIFFLCFPDSVFPLPLSSDVFPCFPIFSYFFLVCPLAFVVFYCFVFNFFPLFFLVFSYLFLFPLFFPVSP